MISSSTQRFSDRVENYVRYRPGYPPEVVDLLVRKAHLSPSSTVADIGSGTGISAEMLLKAGVPVTGVEPNAPMREAAERLLAAYPGFTSVDGTAQATTLPDGSVDLILAAQAFHWFAGAETRAEFSRILKPGGLIALLWNVRQVDTTPFLRDYEALLLEYGTDYNTVRHETIDSRVLGGFFTDGYALHTFTNRQVFGYESLRGRLLSSSYAPAPGQPRHEEMTAELERIFALHQQDGTVSIDYITEVYLGR
ncbi:class I SAM-dependent methyltransferase [Luteolibacter sp. SL250]|uniref:class I SAM-dependent methyltransferase n=1 Tax=Luteolibacter sp. SL250 TaxID=2995170 RepID=UPI002271F0BF|nr:class I SAM-dependent methyltransferase [Luteolibacter sp. SL250]WAC21854.1 class I SAM-dependent methyltransferase [Luteolibacter sp. SL250]